MRDYSLTKKDQKNFIIHYNKEKDGTYSIVFADGSKFCHIEANDDNLGKLERLLESQKEDGKKRYNLLRKRAKSSGVIAAATPVAIATGATLFTAIPAFDSIMSSYSTPYIVCSIGIITILGSIPSFCKFHRNIDTVLEIDKIKYVELHKDVLDTFREHPNALVGIDVHTQSFIRGCKDPFSIDNLQHVGLGDLRLIVENIEKEKKLGFTYKLVKKNTKNSINNK